jgi:hypothetical protein
VPSAFVFFFFFFFFFFLLLKSDGNVGLGS